MPRRSGSQLLLASLKQQSAKALASLQQEITKREKELEGLKVAEARWKGVVGEQPRATGAAATLRKRAVRKRPRLDWNAVLASLPATFTARNIEQKTRKPMEQVYAGVSRWVKDKKVRKNPSGGYQKIAAASAGQQKDLGAQARRKAAA